MSPDRPEFNLKATVETERERVPADVMALPSMLSYEERFLLHWAARAGSDASETIVDAGCFLGGSTLPLGLGTRARRLEGDSHPVRPHDAPRIHSFDLFRVFEERERLYFDEDFPFEIGARTTDLYERNIAQVRDLVEIHEGDINVVPGWSKPISVLFLDVAKSWDTNDTIVRLFFPYLVPGAIVIQQDLVHFGHPWCALTMELLSDHFEFLGHVPYSSAVYRLQSPVSLDQAPTRLLERLSADEAMALIDRSAARVGPPYEGFIRLAGALGALFFDDVNRAQAMIASVAAQYNYETLPWLSDGLKYLAGRVDEVERGVALRRSDPIPY